MNEPAVRIREGADTEGVQVVRVAVLGACGRWAG